MNISNIYVWCYCPELREAYAIVVRKSYETPQFSVHNTTKYIIRWLFIYVMRLLFGKIIVSCLA